MRMFHFSLIFSKIFLSPKFYVYSDNYKPRIYEPLTLPVVARQILGVAGSTPTHSPAEVIATIKSV